MKGRPVFGKVGMTIREYPTGEDTVFDFVLTPAIKDFTSSGIVVEVTASRQLASGLVHLQQDSGIPEDSKKLLCRKAFSEYMIAPPLRQPCPRWGWGAYCDASAVPVQEISPRLYTGNTAPSQPGDAPAAGAKPPRAS